MLTESDVPSLVPELFRFSINVAALCRLDVNSLLAIRGDILKTSLNNLTIIFKIGMTLATKS